MEEEFKIALGDTYTSTYIDNQTFKLADIIDREAGKKLDNPFYKWEYLNSDRKPFYNRKEDIVKSLKFKSWKKIEL